MIYTLFKYVWSCCKVFIDFSHSGNKLIPKKALFFVYINWNGSRYKLWTFYQIQFHKSKHFSFLLLGFEMCNLSTKLNFSKKKMFTGLSYKVSIGICLVWIWNLNFIFHYKILLFTKIYIIHFAKVASFFYKM